MNRITARRILSSYTPNLQVTNMTFGTQHQIIATIVYESRTTVCRTRVSHAGSSCGCFVLIRSYVANMRKYSVFVQKVHNICKRTWRYVAKFCDVFNHFGSSVYEYIARELRFSGSQAIYQLTACMQVCPTVTFAFREQTCIARAGAGRPRRTIKEGSVSNTWFM